VWFLPIVEDDVFDRQAFLEVLVRAASRSAAR
jgi:hypothetical protein